MNKLFIIGNLTRDPELRTTPTGKSVCTINVAVNRRRKVEGQPDADFFRVSVWDAMGETCAKYLSKGKKVAVTGSVSARAFVGDDGIARAQMEITAQDVEFLSPKGDGFTQVEDQDNPFAG